jgi:hypothetical protein
MTNLLKRFASFPFRMVWSWTGVVRDRAIRRLDQRLNVALNVALNEHVGRLADISSKNQISIDLCLESLLRELARLQVRLDELSTAFADGRRTDALSDRHFGARGQRVESMASPFERGSTASEISDDDSYLGADACASAST